MVSRKTLWSIGHSSHTFEELVEMLESFEIEAVADVRRFPGSRNSPWFNKDSLTFSLPEVGIEYHHFIDLGGRRRPLKESHNDAWRLDAFKGYADYMETPEFRSAFVSLEELARQKRTAYMCSEAVWWSCHRSLVSDALKHAGWNVQHIMGVGKSSEHPYTSPARIVDGELVYSKPPEKEDDLFA